MDNKYYFSTIKNKYGIYILYLRLYGEHINGFYFFNGMFQLLQKED